MSLVLDTNALVWVFEGDKALSRQAAESIDLAVSERRAYVSAISFWELALKIRKGKFGLSQPIADWRANVLRLGVREVAIDGVIGIAANALQDMHDDPADRLIVATAVTMTATLVTSDARVLDWKGPLARIDARV